MTTQPPDRLAPELVDYLPFLLAKAAERGGALMEEHLRPLGLYSRTWAVLRLVTERGPMRQVDIGAALDVDRTTITALVDQLERDGLVRRERDPADRRAHAVTSTDEGRRRMAASVSAVEAAEATFTSTLTATETMRAELRRLLGIGD